MIKAIIIDDEERARRVLKNMLAAYCEDVEVLASCSNVPDAVLAINQHKPHVVFCDVEMPKYNGFDLLGFFEKPNFELVFATGYSEYAVKAFAVSAVDYLLKPIQIEQLEAAVAKVRERLDSHTIRERVDTLKANMTANSIHKLALPMSDGLVFVDVHRIQLLQADGSYTNVCLSDGSKLLVSKRLRFFEDLLEGKPEFYRVHRSSIVNINGIDKYSRAEGYIFLESGDSVRIAREKKAAFEDHIATIRL